MVRLSEVKPDPVSWLWPGRIAIGKLTLLAGDPGLGKSFVTLDIASRVSTGAGWPDQPGQRFDPGGVVLLNAEDGVADTIRPRLDAAGADVTRIVALEAIRSVGRAGGRQHASVRCFDLSKDLPALESAIQSVEGCRLVVIDPVSAYLGDVDSHKNGEIRGLLAPLSALAEKHRVAVLTVTHLNKSVGGPAIYRASGSLAFAAAARAAWAVGKAPHDPRLRLLVPIKNNLALDTGGLAYRIETRAAEGHPVVAWQPGQVHQTADDVLGAGGNEVRRPADGGELQEAIDWLKTVLRDGPQSAQSVKSQAESVGFSWRTIQRAKKRAGVRIRKTSFEGGWGWALGDADPGREPGSEGGQSPEVGNLRPEPEESRENRPKDANHDGLAALDASDARVGDGPAGDGDDRPTGLAPRKAGSSAKARRPKASRRSPSPTLPEAPAPHRGDTPRAGATGADADDPPRLTRLARGGRRIARP